MEKRSISAKLFAFVIAVVFVVYLGYQVYTLITEPVRTVQALIVTVDDSILTEGYFARSEMVLVGPG